MRDHRPIAGSKAHAAINEAEHSNWYVVYCQPLKETFAASILREYYELGVYVPEVTRLFNGSVQRTPLFPRYIFVQADLKHIPPSKINATPGVARLVTFDEQPQAIPSDIIATVRQKVHSFNARGGLQEPSLRVGERVHIQDGPLYGLEAIFLGPTTPARRVQILLEFMGRLNTVTIERSNLAAASTPSAERPPRRTRGKGRKIRNYPT